jgi:hypothetical protein
VTSPSSQAIDPPACENIFSEKKLPPPASPSDRRLSSPVCRHCPRGASTPPPLVASSPLPSRSRRGEAQAICGGYCRRTDLGGRIGVSPPPPLLVAKPLLALLFIRPGEEPSHCLTSLSRPTPLLLGKSTNYRPPNYHGRPNYPPKLKYQTFYTLNYLYRTNESPEHCSERF